MALHQEPWFIYKQYNHMGKPLSSTATCSYSNMSKCQGLSWYGVVSVPLARVTCTSVAPLMPWSTLRLREHMLPSKWQLFQGYPCIFQQGNAKQHSAHIAKAWLWKRRVLDWSAYIPDLSPIQNVSYKWRPCAVAHLKTWCLQSLKSLLRAGKRNGNFTKW